MPQFLAVFLPLTERRLNCCFCRVQVWRGWYAVLPRRLQERRLGWWLLLELIPALPAPVAAPSWTVSFIIHSSAVINKIHSISNSEDLSWNTQPHQSLLGGNLEPIKEHDPLPENVIRGIHRKLFWFFFLFCWGGFTSLACHHFISGGMRQSFNRQLPTLPSRWIHCLFNFLFL